MNVSRCQGTQEVVRRHGWYFMQTEACMCVGGGGGGGGCEKVRQNPKSSQRNNVDVHLKIALTSIRGNSS